MLPLPEGSPASAAHLRTHSLPTAAQARTGHILARSSVGPVSGWGQWCGSIIRSTIEHTSHISGVHLPPIRSHVQKPLDTCRRNGKSKLAPHFSKRIEFFRRDFFAHCRAAVVCSTSPQGSVSLAMPRAFSPCPRIDAHTILPCLSNCRARVPWRQVVTFGFWIRFQRDACIRGLMTCRGRAARPIQAPWAQHPPRDHSTTSSSLSSRCTLPAHACTVPSCTRRLPAPAVLEPLTPASCAGADVDRWGRLHAGLCERLCVTLCLRIFVFIIICMVTCRLGLFPVEGVHGGYYHVLK